jgi:hypothetical protein
MWPILVSKEATGPQHSHPLNGFWLRKGMLKLLENTFLYKFLKSFGFFNPTKDEIWYDFLEC